MNLSEPTNGHFENYQKNLILFAFSNDLYNMNTTANYSGSTEE